MLLAQYVVYLNKGTSNIPVPTRDSHKGSFFYAEREANLIFTLVAMLLVSYFVRKQFAMELDFLSFWKQQLSKHYENNEYPGVILP